MGSVPLAVGTTEIHQHCPCVVFWRHILNDAHDPSYTARIWQENTELLEANRHLSDQVRTLEAQLRVEHLHRVA